MDKAYFTHKSVAAKPDPNLTGIFYFMSEPDLSQTKTFQCSIYLVVWNTEVIF